MATSSITKSFVIKTDEAYEIMVDLLETPSEKEVVHTDELEKGKEALARFISGR